MTDRVIDVTDSAAVLSLSLERLRVSIDDSIMLECPLREVAAVVVSHPRASISTALLAALGSHGICLTVCDSKRLPTGMLIGLATHSTQSERFRLQIDASLPLKKRLWQQLVQAKIRGQAEVLRTVVGGDFGLSGLESAVRSGDPDNVEARASRIVWSQLFKPIVPVFRRDRSAPGLNAALNYGYAVVRSLCARAVAGAGLHPTLGLHHHSRYDAFCLADDLMEPFRPLVDLTVARLEIREDDLSIQARRALAAVVSAPVMIGTEIRQLSDAAGLAAASLVRSLESGRPRLQLPCSLLGRA